MKILVSGAAGQLGIDVIEEALRRGHVVIGVDRELPKELPILTSLSEGIEGKSTFLIKDLTDESGVHDTIKETKPDVVIHCAAWTAVDAAEDSANRDKVFDINVNATRYIAEACKDCGCPMMYISTDYVFDGEGAEPWSPDEKDFKPLNYYGETKLEGEKVIAATLDNYFIVRISWVFGQNGNNFVKTMLNVGKTHDEVRVVSDQIGTPTYTPDLARLILDMIQTDKYGVYHASNEGGYISWFDFACEIYRQAGMETKVISVSAEEYGLSAANRPKNSRLDKSKLRENGFELLPTWQDAIKRFLNESESLKALLVSHNFSLTGAPLALFEMAKHLEKIGIKTVTISAFEGPLQKEMVNEGLSVAVVPKLFEENVFAKITDCFDIVVINTLDNCILINEINGKGKPSIWWIHESEGEYINCYEGLPELLQNNISVLTVGKRANQWLHKYRPWFETKELLYTIEDMSSYNEAKGGSAADDDVKTTFAIVGTLSKLKGQDILLEAIDKLSEDEQERCRLVFVGADIEEEVATMIKMATVKEGSNVEYIRNIERKDMPDFYNDIDCLICASRDDSMPMTVIEACMTRRIIICSENTGTAPLLAEYEAGIIYHNDDPAELAECIKQVLENHSDMEDMCNNARRLYEDNFSAEIFRIRLESAINDITEKAALKSGKHIGSDETIRAYTERMREIIEAGRELIGVRKELTDTRQELADMKEQFNRKEADIENLIIENNNYKEAIKEIQNAFFWRISKPARLVLDRAKRIRRGTSKN